MGWDQGWIMAFPLVSSLFSGVEYDRPSLKNLFVFGEFFLLLVIQKFLTEFCILGIELWLVSFHLPHPIQCSSIMWSVYWTFFHIGASLITRLVDWVVYCTHKLNHNFNYSGLACSSATISIILSQVCPPVVFSFVACSTYVEASDKVTARFYHKGAQRRQSLFSFRV